MKQKTWIPAWMQLKFKTKKQKKPKPKKLISCAHCRYMRRVDPKKEISFVDFQRRNDQYEKITQSEMRYGCLSGAPLKRDYIRGKLYHVMTNCTDKNFEGTCKAYRRKWYLFWR